MTEPTGTDAPDLISTGAQALVDNADRLGMTWQLRPATVITSTASGTVTASYDGDDEAIGMVSMIGKPAIGDRVYAISVPPAGNFITGFVAANGARQWALRYRVTVVNPQIDLAIPGNLTSLDIDWTLRTNQAATLAQIWNFRINGAATLDYAYRYQQSSGVLAPVTIQAFGVSSATGGTIPAATAAGPRFGNGRLFFPAWNDPHSGQLGYLFASSFENAANVGWHNVGGGFFGLGGPYTRINFLPTPGSWVVGSQLYARGFITP